jgi:hypothetical protein
MYIYIYAYIVEPSAHIAGGVVSQRISNTCCMIARPTPTYGSDMACMAPEDAWCFLTLGVCQWHAL